MKLDQHLKPYKPQRQEFVRITWDAGLYLRTEGGYRGPYSPRDLPQNWKEKYGPSTRLELYWGDATFTPLPDEGYILDYLFDWKDFRNEPCELAPETDEEEYGRRYD